MAEQIQTSFTPTPAFTSLGEWRVVMRALVSLQKYLIAETEGKDTDDEKILFECEELQCLEIAIDQLKRQFEQVFDCPLEPSKRA